MGPGISCRLTIIAGAEFGSFHNSHGDSLGTAVTVRGYEIPTIQYRADGVQPDSLFGRVVVQASSGGVIQEAAFSVLRTAPSPTWLRLRTVPDISFGGELTIAADAIDWFLDPVRLPGTVTYTFQIIGGAEWGTLVRGSKSGDKIVGVPQFSTSRTGSQGFVFFQARDREPTQPQSVTVKVSASDTAVKPASSSFKVVPSPVIVRANPTPVSFGASSLIEPRIKVNDTTFIPFPADANLYYEIVKGQGIGTLQTPDSQFTGGSISGQYQQMRFNAGPQGFLPDSQEVWVWVIVNNGGSGHSNLNNAQGLGKLLVVKEEEPKCAGVLIDPPGLGVNQIANVLIYEKKPGQDAVPFPAGQMFDLQVIEGGEFIDLISARGDTSDILENVPLPLKLITRNALGVSVKIAASVHMTQVMRAMHMRAVQMLAGVAGNGTNGVMQDEGNICVLPEPMRVDKEEILLGETKYYRTRMAESGVFYIEPAGPTLGEGIAENVWKEGENLPVYKISGPIGGLPIYWEKGRPIPDGSGNLPTGLIRVVGRYWSNDGSYKAGLTAKNGDKSAAVVIEVLKPNELGSTEYARTRRKTVDIRNEPLDIDSLCIFYGGKYGIPPQFIKAHIEQEAGPLQRGVDPRFAPSYRFEPYTAQFNFTEADWGENPFFVRRPDVMGVGNCVPSATCPPEHLNVRVIPYPTTPVTVWRMIEAHSQLVFDIPDDAHRIFGVRRISGKMNYGPYKQMQIFFDVLLANAERENSTASDAEVARIAREAMISFLRDSYFKGLDAMTAQTRLASSYGLLQVMFTTAARQGYPDDDPASRPEDLNQPHLLMDVAINYQKRILRQRLRTSEEIGNWPDGLEKTLRDKVLSEWNTRKTYPSEVMQKISNYIPQK